MAKSTRQGSDRPWTAKTAEAYRQNLIDIITKYRWARGNALYKKHRDGVLDGEDREEAAYEFLRRLRHSKGQAMLKRLQIDENRLKDLKVENEALLLEELDGLGIDREWKNNEGHESDPRMWFHFRLKEKEAVHDPDKGDGATKQSDVYTMDLTELTD